MGFHHSSLNYPEEEGLQFVDVTDKRELAIEPKENNQPIIDSEDEITRKRLKLAIKRKVRRNNLCTPVQQAFAAGSITSLLSHLHVPNSLSCPLMPALLSPTMLAFSCLPVPTLLSPPLLTLSSPLMPALSSPPVSTLLLCSLLALAPTHLTSSALRTFQLALSDESLHCHSTSPSLVGPLHLFPTLSPLSEKNEHKRLFDITFINSRPLAKNHAVQEVDLSFGEYGCPAPVKFNRSWQLEMLDCQVVCIMEAISLATALFRDLIFAPCPCHTMNLISKLGLRMRNITSGVVRETIKSI